MRKETASSSIHPLIYPSTYPSTTPIHLPIHPSIHPLIHLPIHILIHLPIHPSIHQPTHHPSIHHVFISPLLTFHSSSETQGVWVRLTSDSVSWCSQRAILRRTLLPPSFTLTQDSKRSKATEEVSFCASACLYLLPSLVVRGPPRGRGLLSLRTANEAAAN